MVATDSGEVIQDPRTVDLPVQVGAMFSKFTPDLYWVGDGAEHGNIGVVFRDDRPEVWVLQKGERMPSQIF